MKCPVVLKLTVAPVTTSLTCDSAPPDTYTAVRGTHGQKTLSATAPLDQRNLAMQFTLPYSRLCMREKGICCCAHRQSICCAHRQGMCCCADPVKLAEAPKGYWKSVMIGETEEASGKAPQLVTMHLKVACLLPVTSCEVESMHNKI